MGYSSNKQRRLNQDRLNHFNQKSRATDIGGDSFPVNYRRQTLTFVELNLRECLNSVLTDLKLRVKEMEFNQENKDNVSIDEQLKLD